VEFREEKGLKSKRDIKGKMGRVQRGKKQAIEWLNIIKICYYACIEMS
jgi:hypothetical protein